MQQRILSIALALCLCMSTAPKAFAQEPLLSPETPPAEESTAGPVPYEEIKVPSQREAYDAMITQKETYPEGKEWTNADSYTWKGGTAGGIAGTGAGCVAFAYILSDAAFGNLPARMYSQGGFSFSDVKVGDILRVNSDAHTVIVLQVSDVGVVIAEGNYHESGSDGFIHWGRSMSKTEVEAANHYITRYPDGYVDPDGPTANEPVEGGAGTLDGGLAWTLTKAGVLTVSGTGAMPDFNPASGQPWYQFKDQIQKIVIENGVTYLGSCAFQDSNALNVSIPDSITAIGSHAFRASSILSVTIPSSVKTIQSDAFRSCVNLLDATVSDGLESIGERVFQGCKKLDSITLPASVVSVGAGAFADCEELKSAAFVSGNRPVVLGDNLFSRCWKLAKVTLPENIDAIGIGMFQNCFYALSGLRIPQGVTQIQSSAFASCSALSSITIPDSVTAIESSAFSACSALRDIYFGGSETQWNSIRKAADVTVDLKDVTVHYNSAGPDTDPDPGHTHTWDSGAVTRPAGCTSSGVRTYTCSGCGESRTETIPAAGHSYGPFTVIKEATAAENGIRTSTCSACGDIRTEIIPAAGSSSSSNDSASSNTTTRNPDGSTTTTKTDPHTGTVTQITRNPNGSQTVAVRLPARVVRTARRSGVPVTLPIPEVQAARSGETAPLITVNTGSGEPVMVEIPTAAPTFGTVAVLVRADGTEEIIKTSVPTANGVAVAVPDKATVKIVDNRMEFTDVPPQYWAADAIGFVSARRLFAGTTESVFTPEAPMTRAMLMVVLARLDGTDTSGGSTWYEKGMEWAIAGGISDGSEPDKRITREQSVTMLWRYAGSPAATGTLSGFTDAGQISGYAQEAMRWAVENGIISGLSGGQLASSGQATRAQVAQILKNYIEKCSA